MARRLACADEVYAASVGAAAAWRRERCRRCVWARTCVVLSLNVEVEEREKAVVVGRGLEGLKERW